MEFIRWFRTLTTWIRGYTATQEQPPKILETHKSEIVTANLIYDSTAGNFPGIVSAWQLIPQPETLGRYLKPTLNEYAVNLAWLAVNLGIDTEELDRLFSGKIYPTDQQLWFISRHFGLPFDRLKSCAIAPNDLLILCANIAQWKEEVGKLNLGSSDQWRREFEKRSKVELEAQRGILGSHLFMTGWLSKESFGWRVVNEETQHYKHLSAGTTLLVNLQNYGDHIGCNEHAEKIVKILALRAMHTKPDRSNSWEDLFRPMDNPKLEHNWRSWLEHYARKYISKHHVLQPGRMR